LIDGQASPPERANDAFTRFAAIFSFIMDAQSIAAAAQL
jgi:hypothetical protein